MPKKGYPGLSLDLQERCRLIFGQRVSMLTTSTARDHYTRQPEWAMLNQQTD